MKTFSLTHRSIIIDGIRNHQPKMAPAVSFPKKTHFNLPGEYFQITQYNRITSNKNLLEIRGTVPKDIGWVYLNKWLAKIDLPCSYRDAYYSNTVHTIEIKNLGLSDTFSDRILVKIQLKGMAWLRI